MSTTVRTPTRDIALRDLPQNPRAAGYAALGCALAGAAYVGLATPTPVLGNVLALAFAMMAPVYLQWAETELANGGEP